jgi:hypothetical protein
VAEPVDFLREQAPGVIRGVRALSFVLGALTFGLGQPFGQLAPFG